MNAETKIEPTANLNAALVKALAEIGGAAKDKLNPHFKSKYADLASVTEAIKPALARFGLGFTQHCQPAEDGVSVETVVRHESGEQESLGVIYVPANKRDAQGFGSALTYARRYALMTAFGVPAEDDDGNAASRQAPKADPVSRGMMDAKQLADIKALLPKAGRTEEQVAQGFKRSTLVELTAEEADKALGRLKELADA